MWPGPSCAGPITTDLRPADLHPALQVLKVHLLGHRKRIIASLADRPYEEPPQKPPRFSQLRVSEWVGCSELGWGGEAVPARGPVHILGLQQRTRFKESRMNINRSQPWGVGG